MSIENIKKKITEEAIQKASLMKQEALKELVEDLTLFEEGEKEKAEKTKEQKIASLKEDFSRKIDSEKLHIERRILKEKRFLIDKLFEEALDEILAMDSGVYQRFLMKIVERDAPKDGNFVVFFNESDLKKYKKEFGKFLKEKFGNRASISSEVAKIKGGFLIKSDIYVIDDSLEEILANYREKNEISLAKKLFEE